MRRTSLYLLLLAALGLIASSFSACSPLYVIEGGYTQARILLAREPIEEVLQDPQTSEAEKSALTLTGLVREYAATLGMQPQEAYTSYVRLHRHPLAWVVSAAHDDSFDLIYWWFPIVGRVPYRGFFAEGDAQCFARRTERDGIETWMRGTDAFSTLGWFDDPVMSSMIQGDEVDISSLILHELFHRVVWVPGHVDFNESAAQFVGMRASISFFEWLCSGNTAHRAGAWCDKIPTARIAFDRSREFARQITALYDSLDLIYRSTAPREEKLRKKAEVFNNGTETIRKSFPKFRGLSKPNNAELMHLRLYFTGTDAFEMLFQSCSEQWECFFNGIKKIAEQCGQADADPFALMAQQIASFGATGTSTPTQE